MRITPIIKIVGMDCNLRCGYCYYEDASRENMGIVMPLALIQSLLSALASNGTSKKVGIVWHGGEPLVAGIGYFREIMEIQKDITEVTGAAFENRIQTNGTLITDKWGQFFSENNFRVGISLDGPDYIHDAYRVDVNGSGSFEEVFAALEICREYKLDVGCLAVATDAAAGKGKELFEFFISHGINGFRVKPCYEVDPDTGEVLDFSIKPKDYAQILIEMFDAWIELDDPSVRCGPVKDYLRGLLGRCQSQCVFKRKCIGYWGVWPDGSVYQCEFSNRPDALIGNLNDSSVEELVLKQKNVDLSQRMLKIGENCSSCQWLKFCHGGCSRYDVGIGRDVNVFCGERKLVFTHMQDYLSKG